MIKGKRTFKKKEANGEGTNDNTDDETPEISVVDEDIAVESPDSSDDISIIEEE